MSTLTLLLVATGLLAALFSVVYLWARRLDNYGIVDVAWPYAFSLLAAGYAWGGTGWPVRRALLVGLVAAWSLRLGTHLLVRVAGHHPVEDARYGQLRRNWAANFAAKMFQFFQFQAISVVLLGLGFLPVAQNTTPTLAALEWAGLAVGLLAVAGEALADAQLAAFKRRPENRGRVCDVGLWRYSRHPNYFCEWLAWVGFALFALASPYGWIGLLGPAGILYLLLRVTGIPMAEEQSLRSKGDAYRRYQETTSVFFPRPPRRPAA